MKNIKKLLAVLLAAALCLSLAACGAPVAKLETLETSSTVSEGETAPAEKEPVGYDKDIQGLCKFMEDSKLVTGEKVQMSYDVIGAVNGYKYAYTYNSSSVQVEVYEFATENIPETAQAVIDAVRADGSFVILENTVPATLSADNHYLMIYTDGKAEKDEINGKHKTHVLERFAAFAAAEK